MRKTSIMVLVAVLSLFMALPVLAQIKGGAMMTDDVYTPISKGYDLIRNGKYEAAKFEFQTAVKKDPNNPFALNNLAVLEEEAGKLNDAMAFLQQATLHAAEYKDKITQTCFVGGGCMAVQPVRGVAEKSEIAPIVAENIKKLEAKMAAAKAPGPPGTPPAAAPVPKTPPTKKDK